MSKPKFLARCAARAAHVTTLGDGTMVVPSVSQCPNRTVRAWAEYLGIDLAATPMMIESGEPGRCWVKGAGHSTVVAHG